jgi:hypothetical protein
VERNPVRGGLVKRAQDWPHSSAAAHVGGRDDLLAQAGWLGERTAGWVCTWGEYLAQQAEPAPGDALHRCENTGRPLGEKPFIERLARQLGRNLLPSKGGRPRKKNQNQYGVPGFRKKNQNQYGVPGFSMASPDFPGEYRTIQEILGEGDREEN